MKDKIESINTISSTSIFVLTFLLIGIPIWWKTTTVYRYSIPHHECQGLLSEIIQHTIPVKIIVEDRKLQQGLFWEQLLKISRELKEDKTEPIVTFQWSMSLVSDEEQLIINSATNVTDLDKKLTLFEKDAAHSKEHNHQGEIKILILNKYFSSDPRFTFGNNRRAYIFNSGDHKQLGQDVLSLSKMMGQVAKLQKLYTHPSTFSTGSIPDKDRMRYLKFARHFDITFSLIVPEPQILDVHWDVQTAVETYLKSIQDNFKLISTIKVKSQVLYMTSLPIHAEIVDGVRKLRAEQLPSLINPIEAKLGSDTSVQPNLNFVLYIPTKEQTPLHIFDSEGNELRSNAFLVPQWGGIMMYNSPLPENASLPHKVNIDSHIAMKVFLSQLRLLLGLSDINAFCDDSCQVLKGPIIQNWELDFLLRKNAQEHLSSSISSLSSLSQLLQTIQNIVIKDEIGEKIHFALSSVKESLQHLASGNLLEGFKHAQSAFVASDEAFFDPSLLSLLYFPERQKYAIYIPLFLPISIPVLTSLLYLWKFHKQRIKTKTE